MKHVTSKRWFGSTKFNLLLTICTSLQFSVPVAKALDGLDSDVGLKIGNGTVTVLPDGTLLQIGNSLADPASVIVAKYDPKNKSVENLAPLTGSTGVNCAVLLKDGRVLAQGRTNVFFQDIFNPKTNTWSRTKQASTPFSVGTQCALMKDGRVVLSSGLTSSPLQIYSPDSDSWSVGPSLVPTGTRSAFFGQALTLKSGKVLFFLLGNFQEVYAFDPSASGSISSVSKLFDIPNVGATVTELEDGRLMVIGGWKQAKTYDFAHPNAVENIYSVTGASAEVTIYDISSGTAVATPGPRLLRPRNYHSAILLKNGKLMVIGGDGVDDMSHYAQSDIPRLYPTTYNQYLNDNRVTAEVFDPALNSWSFSSRDLGVTVWNEFTPKLLPSGKVYLQSITGNNPSLLFYHTDEQGYSRCDCGLNSEFDSFCRTSSGQVISSSAWKNNEASCYTSCSCELDAIANPFCAKDGKILNTAGWKNSDFSCYQSCSCGLDAAKNPYCVDLGAFQNTAGWKSNIAQCTAATKCELHFPLAIYGLNGGAYIDSANNASNNVNACHLRADAWRDYYNNKLQTGQGIEAHFKRGTYLLDKYTANKK